MEIDHSETPGIHSLGNAPVKLLCMAIFMCWNIGSELSIFTLLMLKSMFSQILTGIWRAQHTFRDFEKHTSTKLPFQEKCKYFSLHFLSLLVCLYMLVKIGILPLYAFQWIDRNLKPSGVLLL
ncbi:transmembrane protein [Perkinsela sp. CCAP 1560/4]|nr:transmembrane protein [Perkinsela sp. CCAP 1560/4]|eukprot:KNH05191.1 transmembrane protein [Perkinsela sp. CCAP 1560/4]